MIGHAKVRTAVLVGVEGTSAGAAAVDWAAHEAALTRRPLRLLHSLDRMWPQERRHREGPILTPAAGAGPDVLATAEARVHELEPDVEVRVEASARSLREALVIGSESAYETVIAKHDDQDAPGPAMIGSSALRVVALAHGRVVVVPTRPHEGGEVVAAVDGSNLDGAIAEYAFAQAESRDATLRVLHAWQSPNAPLRNSYVVDPYEAEHDARSVADELINRIGPRFPGVKAIPEVLHEHPVRALDDAAQHAALLVVGARGRNGVTRFFLGSVSTAVINHAPCPVAVIPCDVSASPPEKGLTHPAPRVGNQPDLGTSAGAGCR